MIERSLVLLMAILLVRCAPEVIKASARNPDLFEKPGSALHMAGRPPGQSPAPEMYVRQSSIQLERVDAPNETGSLFNPEDERNFLFTSAGPHKLGRFLTIQVASNLKAKDKKPEEPAKAKEESQDAVEKELLAAIPELAPADPGETRLIDDFKMKITHRFDNGDVMTMMNRRSVNGEQVEDVTVTARVPYDRLMAGDALTTGDLLDVKIVSSKDGEVAERRSSGWEDEYSLRLSGFDEAKSKVAMEIDDKRRKLDEARANLQTRIKTFSKEREQVAKLRDEVSKEKGQLDEERKQWEEKVDEKESALEDANAALKSKDEQIAELEKKGADEEDGKKAAKAKGD